MTARTTATTIEPIRTGIRFVYSPSKNAALEVVEVRHVPARMAAADDGRMTTWSARGVGRVRWQPYNEGAVHGNQGAQAVRAGAPG